MLDNASDLYVVCVTVLLMLVFAIGGSRVCHLGIQRYRRWRVDQIKRECAAPTYLRVVYRSPRTAEATQKRDAARDFTTARQGTYSESTFVTTSLRFPGGDVA